MLIDAEDLIWSRQDVDDLVGMDSDFHNNSFRHDEK